MTKIHIDIYQFTEYIPPIQLTIHQYLLLTEEPVLIHTGTTQQLKKNLPLLRELMDKQKLKYVLVSHFESDECGGLFALQKEFPDVITICSDICSRQLPGFGFKGKVMTKKNGDTLDGKDYKFVFFDYPSEIHLQNGLLFIEEQRGVFFSSDLMFRVGDAQGKTIESKWQTEVDSIGIDRVANEDKLKQLKLELLKHNPKFIAVGHGHCVDLI